jgi:hypothetical protein
MHPCKFACLEPLLSSLTTFLGLDDGFLQKKQKNKKNSIENEFKLTYTLESFVAHYQQLNIVGPHSKNANKNFTRHDRT